MAKALTEVDLPYRKGVGIMLLNGHGQVWVGRRTPKWLGHGAAPIWQMPQGGIERGEEPRVAAKRELREETGIRHAQVIAAIPEWLTSDLPSELLGIALKGRFRGHRQLWFAMRFTGDDSEIDISGSKNHKPEFDMWKWASIEDVTEQVTPFKREMYRTIVHKFQHLADTLPILGQP